MCVCVGGCTKSLKVTLDVVPQELPGMCAAGFPGRLNMRTDTGGCMLPGNTSEGKWREAGKETTLTLNSVSSYR